MQPEKTAHGVKCLSREHEDPSSDPQSPCKKLDTAVSAYGARTRRGRQKDPRDSLASLSSQSVSSRCSGRPCLNKIRYRASEEDSIDLGPL